MGKKLFSRVIIAILIVASTVSYGEVEVIKFASSIYPPFTMLRDGQVLYGFDVDIVKALCGKLNVKCTFNNDKFSNMASALKSHKYDAWINEVTICEEHQKDITFTNSYLSSKVVLIATKNTFFNAAPVEIKGKTIGVAADTCYVQYLKNTYGDTINIKIFSNEKESLIALEKGVVDAVIDDEIVLKWWRLTHNVKDKYRLINLPAKYSSSIWYKCGIAVAKDNPVLVKKLNNAIDRIKSDGTYNKLVKKYLLY